MTETDNIKIEYWKTHNHFIFEKIDVKKIVFSFLRGYNIGFFSPLVQKIWCEGRLLGGERSKQGEYVEITFDSLELPKSNTDEIAFSGAAMFAQTDTKTFIIKGGEISGSIHIPRDTEFKKFIESVLIKKRWS
jgi:hypothetical protein